MCGGGPSGPSDEDKKKADQRHEENLALQKEQMEEQKRQFELSRRDNQTRYAEQKAQAQADPPPPPEKTAQVAAPALDRKRSGDGRKQFRNPVAKPVTKSSSHAAKSLYVPK